MESENKRENSFRRARKRLMDEASDCLLLCLALGDEVRLQAAGEGSKALSLASRELPPRGSLTVTAHWKASSGRSAAIFPQGEGFKELFIGNSFWRGGRGAKICKISKKCKKTLDKAGKLWYNACTSARGLFLCARENEREPFRSNANPQGRDPRERGRNAAGRRTRAGKRPATRQPRTKRESAGLLPREVHKSNLQEVPPNGQ